jgi:[ribosomal protein S18]-alanine N-acetyltransferase
MKIIPYNKLHHSSLIEILRLNTPTYFDESEESDFVEYLEHHLEHYFVVENEGKIWACGGFNLWEEGTIARISWDIVHPEAQGKGYGSALTKFRIAQIQQIPTVKVIWVRTSQLAYLFYEKLGFELKFIEKDYWAKGFDLYQMERSV